MQILTYFTSTMFVLIALSSVIVASTFFIAVKYFFGTFSIKKAIEDSRERARYSKRYNELFSARENFIFHISWAKSRGDFAEAQSMAKELQQLDNVRFLLYLNLRCR